MILSIIIPVFNEKSSVLELLDRVEKAPVRLKKEIILVDDFSTDGTREILGRLARHKVFYHRKNRGKGAAIRTGLKHASGDIMIIQDADLEYDPRDYQKLIQPIVDGRADVVYGSRFIGKKAKWFGKDKTLNISHYIGNKFLTWATNLLYGITITDMETCYKVFRKQAIRNIKLRARRFDFEPEITAKLSKQGYKIYDVPINFSPRDFNKGKKITKLDGIKALYYLIKYRIID